MQDIFRHLTALVLLSPPISGWYQRGSLWFDQDPIRDVFRRFRLGEREHYREVWTACHFLDERSVAVEQGSCNGDSFHWAMNFPECPFTHRAHCYSFKYNFKKKHCQSTEQNLSLCKEHGHFIKAFWVGWAIIFQMVVMIAFAQYRNWWLQLFRQFRKKLYCTLK